MEVFQEKQRNGEDNLSLVVRRHLDHPHHPRRLRGNPSLGRRNIVRLRHAPAQMKAQLTVLVKAAAFILLRKKVVTNLE